MLFKIQTQFCNFSLSHQWKFERLARGKIRYHTGRSPYCWGLMGVNKTFSYLHYEYNTLSKLRYNIHNYNKLSSHYNYLCSNWRCDCFVLGWPCGTVRACQHVTVPQLALGTSWNWQIGTPGGELHLQSLAILVPKLKVPTIHKVYVRSM